MSDDVVKRLREGRSAGSHLQWMVTALDREAADEIERLRGEIAGYSENEQQLEAWIQQRDAEIERLRGEIERLREQLRLANIDAVGAHGDANELRSALAALIPLTERLIDTRRCRTPDLRALNAARAALKEAAS